MFEVGSAICLEGAVADEFGVEAAIVGVVDLFGHDAVEGGAYFCDGFGGVDGEGGGGLGGGDKRRNSEEQGSEREETHALRSLELADGVTFTERSLPTVVEGEFGVKQPGTLVYCCRGLGNSQCLKRGRSRCDRFHRRGLQFRALEGIDFLRSEDHGDDVGDSTWELRIPRKSEEAV